MEVQSTERQIYVLGKQELKSVSQGIP